MTGLLTDSEKARRLRLPSSQAIPRRPSLSLRSSASTSFMLAALRVLHVDASHAPAKQAVIEGKAPLITYQLHPRVVERTGGTGHAAFGSGWWIPNVFPSVSR
jgi:hypothetical protein